MDKEKMNTNEFTVECDLTDAQSVLEILYKFQEYIKKHAVQGERGEKGDTGLTPNIQMGATVDENVGVPMVQVVKSGSNENPSFTFKFLNLKGEQGEVGATGLTPNVTVDASVDNAVGTPSVEVVKGGTTENPSFTLNFKNLKGQQGEQGEAGKDGENGKDGANGANAPTITGVTFVPYMQTNIGNYYTVQLKLSDGSTISTAQGSVLAPSGRDGLSPQLYEHHIIAIVRDTNLISASEKNNIYLSFQLISSQEYAYSSFDDILNFIPTVTTNTQFTLLNVSGFFREKGSITDTNYQEAAVIGIAKDRNNDLWSYFIPLGKNADTFSRRPFYTSKTVLFFDAVQTIA